MSLSAEYYMLKNAAVQNLVLVRNKQIEQICTYINSMGYTAALICGFAVSTYSDVAGDRLSGSRRRRRLNDAGGQGIDDGNDLFNTDDGILSDSPWTDERNWLVVMGITTALCVSAALHCIVFSMYLRMWAERLALRGPTGSITRSIRALQGKAKHVKVPFVLMLVFFTCELISSFWLLDVEVSKRFVMTLIVLVFGASTATMLVRTYACFKISIPESSLSDRLRGSQDDTSSMANMDMDDRKSAASTMFDSTGYEELLGDSIGFTNKARGTTRFGEVTTDPDIGITVMSDLTRSMDSFHRDFKQDRANIDAIGTTGNGKRVCGVLEKRSSGNGGFANWQQRFFVLESHEFVYYKSKESFMNGDMPCKKKVFTLAGYEVIVTNDAYFSFSLCPIKGTVAENKRRWDFRAATEADRLRWLRALIFACDAADDDGSTDTDLSSGGEREARAYAPPSSAASQSGVYSRVTFRTAAAPAATATATATAMVETTPARAKGFPGSFA